jgi:glycerol-3-phosphate acyltransferase PlsY
MAGAPDWVVPLAALAVFLGHLYPVFHRFRGGKGVATAAGILFALYWPLALLLTLVWLVMAFGFRISSLAGLTAAVLMPLGMFVVFGPAPRALVTVPIALLLFWRHRSNIASMLAGNERRIGG